MGHKAPIAPEAVEGVVVEPVLYKAHETGYVAPKDATADSPCTTRLRNGHWKPGESGNPKGRPKALGNSLAEWYSTLGAVMHERGGKPYLERLRDDETEPFPKRQAAVELLDSLTPGHAKSGKPFRADARDAIHDRTVGKPQQQLDVTVTDETPLAAIRERFAALLAASPDGAAVLAAVAGRVGMGAGTAPAALPEAPETPPEGPSPGVGV